MTNSASGPTFELDARLLRGGVALLCIGGGLWLIGAALSATALGQAARKWVEQWDESPAEKAQRTNASGQGRRCGGLESVARGATRLTAARTGHSGSVGRRRPIELTSSPGSTSCAPQVVRACFGTKRPFVRPVSVSVSFALVHTRSPGRWANASPARWPPSERARTVCLRPRRRAGRASPQPTTLSNKKSGWSSSGDCHRGAADPSRSVPRLRAASRALRVTA